MARIFLLNTLVTFLTATPSLVWLFTAALRRQFSAPASEETQISPYNAVGALSQLFRNGISLVDDKVLVKHLEDLSALEVRHDAG